MLSVVRTHGGQVVVGPSAQPKLEPRRDYECPAGPPLRFTPWRDDSGREHPSVPRCCGYTNPRNSWSSRVGDCRRKGVVQRGSEPPAAFDPALGPAWILPRERWYCLQHDPARKDEKRVAELAPSLRDLLAEALELVPATKRSADWRRRAEALLEKARPRR